MKNETEFVLFLITYLSSLIWGYWTHTAPPPLAATARWSYVYSSSVNILNIHVSSKDDKMNSSLTDSKRLVWNQQVDWGVWILQLISVSVIQFYINRLKHQFTRVLIWPAVFQHLHRFSHRKLSSSSLLRSKSHVQTLWTCTAWGLLAAIVTRFSVCSAWCRVRCRLCDIFPRVSE